MEDACLVQGSDEAAMLVIRTSSGSVMFFSCDDSGTVLKRPDSIKNICCIAALETVGNAPAVSGARLI